MAVAFRSSSQSADGTSATSVTKPTGAVSTDLLFQIANCFDDASAATFTWSSGFTQIAVASTIVDRSSGASPNTHRITLGIAWKIAGGSEPSSYTVTNGASSYQNLMMLAYTGADQTTPIDVSSATTFGDGNGARDGTAYTATWATLGASVSRAGSMALAVLGGYDKDGATPSTYTARINAMDGVNDSSDLAVNAGALTSPSAAIASNLGGASNAVALHLVIIQPPGTGASATSSAPTLSAGATGGALFAGASSSAPTLSGSATMRSLAAAAASSAPTLAAAAASVAGISHGDSDPTLNAAATGAALFAGAASSAPTLSGGVTGIALFAGAASSAPTLTGAATSTATTNTYFRDDFTGSSVDTTIWTVLNRISDPSNSELNCYVPAMTGISGGALQLTAEVHTQSCGDSERAPTSQAYRSGGIVQKLAPFRYGTITFSAKAPAETGAWPAIWMMGYLAHASHAADPGTFEPSGSNWPNGGWGEIDIWEIFSPTNSGNINQQIHQDANNDGGAIAAGFDPTAAFHTYQLIWTSGSLVWKVDGSTTRTITGAQVSSNPMFLIVNHAIGGTGGGTPSNGTFPSTMEVQYIEVLSDTTNATSAPALTANATGQFATNSAGAASSAPTLSADATTSRLANVAGAASSAPTLSADATSGSSAGVSGAASAAPTLAANATTAMALAAAASSAPALTANVIGIAGNLASALSSAPTLSADATSVFLILIPAAASCAPLFNGRAISTGSGGGGGGVGVDNSKWRPGYWHDVWFPDYFPPT